MRIARALHLRRTQLAEAAGGPTVGPLAPFEQLIAAKQQFGLRYFAGAKGKGTG